MPELPDVEIFKEYLDATSLHKTIQDMDVDDKRVLEGISIRGLKRTLIEKKLHHSRRHGKYLLANLESRKWLVFHFGMTGFLKYYKNKKVRPNHARVLLSFTNGYHLAYVSQRMLGEVALFNGDLDHFITKKNLGPDAGEMGWDEFKRTLKSRKGNAKSTLMKQELIAGLGNIYTDEILYQARVHPKSKVADLKERQLKSLFNTMKEVLKTAIECRADPTKFPSSYEVFVQPYRGF